MLLRGKKQAWKGTLKADLSRVQQGDGASDELHKPSCSWQLVTSLKQIPSPTVQERRETRPQPWRLRGVEDSNNRPLDLKNVLGNQFLAWPLDTEWGLSRPHLGQLLLRPYWCKNDDGGAQHLHLNPSAGVGTTSLPEQQLPLGWYQEAVGQWQPKSVTMQE